MVLVARCNWERRWDDFNFGLASAVSYIIFALVVVFAILNFRLVRSDDSGK
jgi:ABC-type sugar transport system permease subunit